MSRWKQILVIICGLLALSVLLAACGGASDGGSNYPERSRPTAAPAAPLAPAATALLKPRWDVHLSGDGDQLGCAGESLSSVLGE